MTRPATKLATVGDILRQRCPRCRVGSIFRYSIFRGFPKMHERCPVCDLKFDREPGYFLGAMYVSYGLGIVIVALTAALLWSITGWWITKDIDLGSRAVPPVRTHDHTLCPRPLDLPRPGHRPRTATLTHISNRHDPARANPGLFTNLYLYLTRSTCNLLDCALVLSLIHGSKLGCRPPDALFSKGRTWNDSLRCRNNYSGCPDLFVCFCSRLNAERCRCLPDIPWFTKTLAD